MSALLMCYFVASKRFLSLVMEQKQKAETKEMKKVQPKRKKIKRKRKQNVYVRRKQ